MSTNNGKTAAPVRRSGNLSSNSNDSIYENIQKQVEVPVEVINMLKAMGVAIPPQLKEIKTEVERSESQRYITIPKTMTKLEAANELTLQYKNEEQVISLHADFNEWNWKDVLVSVKKVTEKVFGWVNSASVESFFGAYRPSEIDIVIDSIDGKKVTEQAFIGEFCVTPWEGAGANLFINRGKVCLRLEVKRKFSEEVTNYFNAIRHHLETSSIYRGKTIVVTADAGEEVNFEIVENKGSDKIVLNHKEQVTLDNFVTAPLGEPGKRTYLFTGDFGNAKTETAMKVGRDAVEKGMSFFYVKESHIFEQLLRQSKKYQPCVIFMEDIDEITSGEERDEHMNKILNMLDGMETKGNDLTVIFTTNAPEKINSALRRPGRIDLVIEFNKPDDETRKKIFELLLEGEKGYKNLDFDYLASQIKDVSGAVLAEICMRARKLAKKEGFITNEKVVASIASMEYHIKLMSGKAEVKNPADKLFDLLCEVMNEIEERRSTF